MLVPNHIGEIVPTRYGFFDRLLDMLPKLLEYAFYATLVILGFQIVLSAMALAAATVVLDLVADPALVEALMKNAEYTELP